MKENQRYNVTKDTTIDLENYSAINSLVDIKGTKPIGFNDYIILENNIVKEGVLTIDNYKVTIENGKATTVESIVGVTGLKLNLDTSEVIIGKTLQLTGTVSPANATDQMLSWKTSNPEIAVVDENGLVTGTGIGEVTITATTMNGVEAVATITVKDVCPADMVKGEGICYKDFAYSGSVETFTVDYEGTYKLEVWGAQGSNSGGKGGYSVGKVYLNKNTDLFVYSGGAGSGYTGGFNGGGNGKYSSYTNDSGTGSTYAYAGGGGSDIRIGTDSLYARVIVAGGGSGYTSGYYYAGGGTTGLAGNTSYQATQINAGNGGSFGVGCSQTTTNYKYVSGGGGGGWYGGGSRAYSDSTTSVRSYSGGGSGWVYTAASYSNWLSGNATDANNYLLDSTYYLEDAETIAGNVSFTSPTGEAETGHTGNGYARITYYWN